MGEQYLKKEYGKAQEVLLKSEGGNAENAQDGYYSLNLNPNDPLFPHAATLAHLVMGENMIQYWEKYKKDVDKGEYEEMGTGTISAALWLKGANEGIADAKYSDVDHVRADKDLFSVKYPPFLCSYGLKKLNIPEEWSKEVADMKGRLDKTESLRQEIDRQVEALMRVKNSEARKSDFGTVEEAMQWLTENNGAWLSIDPHYSRDDNESVRIVMSFKVGYGDQSGSFVMGNVQAEKGYDVGTSIEGIFRVESVYENIAHVKVRGNNGSVEFNMSRTDNDHAQMNDRAMIRVRK